MVREIVTHKVNAVNDGLTITAADERGPGNANHQYDITSEHVRCRIQFQSGTLMENGINGVTHEALLAILRDRLEGFQSGPYACEPSKQALDAVNAATAALKRRTEERAARRVEGTMTI